MRYGYNSGRAPEWMNLPEGCTGGERELEGDERDIDEVPDDELSELEYAMKYAGRERDK